MRKSIYNTVNKEFERKQKRAFDRLMLRTEEVYSKIPSVEAIDQRIKSLGIHYNKLILQGKDASDTASSRLQSEISGLKAEKETLLLDFGYPDDYLKAVYECCQCSDTGFIQTPGGSEKCICYKQKLINLLHQESNLKLAETENFSVFDEGLYPDTVSQERYGIPISPRENILCIKERCLQFIENFDFPEEKNLFFSGPTGVGKTFMSNCISMEIMKRGKTVLYQTAPRIFDIINEYKMKAFKDEAFEDSTYKNIFEVELLVIDDLGTERQSAARFAELLNILNTRHINNLSRPCKTIISTNIEAKELYEYYKERVLSRVIGYFDMFRFAGEDIRRIKKVHSI